MKKYTVILMYPVRLWPSTEEPETYCNTVSAVDADMAEAKVRQMAYDANDGAFDMDELILLYVFEGDLTPETSCMA